MKKFGVGGSRPETTVHGRCLVTLLGLLLASSAPAFVDRRAWIFEQLVTPPAPTHKNEMRYQASLQAVNYRDAFSTQGSVLLDLREFEIGLKASQRIFASIAAEGEALRTALYDDRSTFSLELGRNYVAPSGTFGRLGVELFQFLPSSTRWLKLGLSTGRLETPGQPWELRLQINYLLSLRGGSAFLIAQCESAKHFVSGDSSFQLGGFLTWSNHIRTLTAVGVHEYMLFSFGPWVGWTGPLGRFRLTLPARLWLDQEIFTTTAGDIKGYPTSLSPAAGLSWTVTL